MSGHPGSRQMPLVLSAPRRGEPALLLEVGLGDDLCFVIVALEDFLSWDNEFVLSQCVHRGWLVDSAPLSAGTVEEVGPAGLGLE